MKYLFGLLVMCLMCCENSVIGNDEQERTDYSAWSDSAIMVKINETLDTNMLTYRTTFKNDTANIIAVFVWHPLLLSLKNPEMIMSFSDTIDLKFLTFPNFPRICFNGHFENIPDDFASYPGKISIAISRKNVCAKTTIQMGWLQNRYPDEDFKFCTN